MQLVETSVSGRIHTLRMARPPVNALNPELCRDIASAVAQAVASGAHGVILAGGTKVFSAGLDVPHLLSLGEDADSLSAAWEAFFDAARALARCPVPVVAAVTGHSPAGGCVLALCCDYRIMAAGNYRIGLNETRVGLIAPESVQHLLGRVVGQYRAERLLVAGELVDAQTALQLGLVDELADSDQVVPRAQAWLEALLELPRQPVLRTRAIARADMSAALEPERIGLSGFIESWGDPDTQAGLRALVARLGK